MRKSVVLALCATIICSVLVVTLLLYPANQPKTLEDAIAKAIDYFKESREPYALLWLDVMHRRFGIEAFADALQRYDQVLAENTDVALLRIFRRIVDHDNQPQDEDFQAVTAETDLVTVPALYCDRMGLPSDYSGILKREANRGGYYLTHVLLALIWIQENGCEPPVPSTFVDGVCRATAALIDDNSIVEDLELEAAAFLYLAGQGELVDDAFDERVIAAQLGDGGWAQYLDRPDESTWHATILGLLFLLHIEHPADSYPPMLNPESPD